MFKSAKIHADNVANNFLQRTMLQGTEEKFMKGSNILADNVANKFLQRKVLQNTEEKFMKGSNILADNVANNLLIRKVLQNTEEKFMKDLNILADNVAKKQKQVRILAKALVKGPLLVLQIFLMESQKFLNIPHMRLVMERRCLTHYCSKMILPGCVIV